ncbi:MULTISPECIES: MFS transporter [Streptomyces]|uniref:MFS transporter n=1 Tax=Streptomyces TaxID=1883 RepID=UPI00095B90BB|nr:MFS transporter [Streptomyces sp. CB02115]OKJ53271.1 MFS transporter [Streptomyces sp. CB02115]WST89029.1 MFS transporter [Streptomyces anulatus]WSU32616.1 MFS transporter [Streptomyces anulatus]WSU88533.1 MFS transporter [Streptomyces anulatus]
MTTTHIAVDPTVFWRFWFSSTMSRTGSNITAVALPLVALSTLNASTFQVTLLAAASQAAWLFLGLPAGVIVQKLPLRGLQVSMDLVCAVAMGSIPVAWWLDSLTFGHLLFTALITSLATVLFEIASATFLPELVSKEELTSRNSLMSATEAVTQTGGPSVSGLLIKVFGAANVLVIDSISYLVSAVTLWTLPERRPKALPQVPVGALIREGCAFVMRHPVMRPCAIWATVNNFFTAALMALTPLYLVREAGASPTLVGLVIAADGAGALLGSMVTTRLAARFGTARAIIVSGVVGGALALVIPMTTTQGDIGFFIAGNAAVAMAIVIGSILTRTHRQVESPPELLSRVMATVRFISWGALPLGALLSGVLADSLGLRPALWTVCAGFLLAPLVLIMSTVRKLRDLSEVRV